MSIDLNEAKENFIKLMRSLNKIDQQKFLAFIIKEWKLEPSMVYDQSGGDMCNNDEVIDDPIFILNSIAFDIKKKIPLNAILPSENIIKPLSGENSDCHPDITLHLDMFLYDDEDVDELVDSGQLRKYYCTDCGSRNTRSLITVSHSMSRDYLYFIFNTLLPTLKDKTVLDVGSRLGAVLYGAYVYTDAKRIIGVEMNEEFCNLQNYIIYKYKMDHRISILHNRIEDIPEIIKESDVIIINNPFEFYLSKDIQIEIWEFLKATIRKGTILVTCPFIEITFKTLQIKISLEKWLKPFEKLCSKKFPVLFEVDKEDYSCIGCYEVL